MNILLHCLIISFLRKKKRISLRGVVGRGRGEIIDGRTDDGKTKGGGRCAATNRLAGVVKGDDCGRNPSVLCLFS